MSHRIRAAQGGVECDLLLRGARYLDVFHCEWRVGDLAIADGTIVGVEPGLRAREEVDARELWAVPGFIDAHVHVESSLLTPAHFQKAVLPRGTTTAICDPHELANVAGPEGIRYFLESSSAMDMDLWVMLSSCVPATHLETNGGGAIDAATLEALSAHPRALGLAEMMNMPGVLAADDSVIEKIAAFSERPRDGHCPLLRGQQLSAYAAAGISSCHESSELEEAREKLSKGIAVWVREGSVAKDLKELLPLLTLATSTSLGFCTDDRNPLDIMAEGHVDHLVREAIRRGVAPEIAYRSASWTAARHYGLDRGFRRVGAVAPGYEADLVLLGDPQACSIASVLKTGRWAHELPAVKGPRPVAGAADSVRAAVPEALDLLGPEGRVHVIGAIEGKIITDRHVMNHDEPGVARLSVLERYGRGQPPANAYVRGFGDTLRGAIASSVGHDSHNLIAVGDRTDDMRIAMAALIESGGGFCVVRDGQVLSRLALPIGGLMCESEPHDVSDALTRLKDASRAIGCQLNEPFLQLAFMSLPVIPSLKLTDRGLVDVNEFRIIDVRAS